MTALATRSPRTAKGHDRPRIAPPIPARSGFREFAEFSAGIGIHLRPWQETAARYLTAKGQGDRWLYREVAVIVARQNGKTTLLVPLIVQRLLDGHRIMHTAQNRDLPREVFERVAEVISAHHETLLPERNGRRRRPRFANGQEEIRLTNGGHYRIVAPTRGGARGPSNDLVIIDELREMEDFDFIAAAKPTLTASTRPQMLYLSNAGTEDSEVLNALRSRADADPALAYLEWSASPDRAVDSIEGWAESNPSLGHDEGQLLQTLHDDLRASQLEGSLSVFETEHLCRWVKTMREMLVSQFDWVRCRVEKLDKPYRPVMAVSLDPDRRRASAFLAWSRRDGTIVGKELMDRSAPLDTDALGEELDSLALKYGVLKTAYDPITDAELVKYLKKRNPEPVNGQKFASASSQFVNIVESGKLAWAASDHVSDDLTWTARRSVGTNGAYEAVRAQDDRPITAALAAIRAIGWLASGPRPKPLRLY